MRYLQYLSKLDRRFVYLLLSLAVTIPLLVTLNIRHFVDKSSRDLFDAVDRIPANGQAVLIAYDYDPQIMAELEPMAIAILRHCLAKKIRVMGMSTGPQGASLGERAVSRTVREFNDTMIARHRLTTAGVRDTARLRLLGARLGADTAKYGIDYAYFGYRPTLVILWLGESTKKSFPSDHYGRPFDSLPMMKHIRNYDDIPLVVDLAGSGIVTTWIIYAGARYRAKIGAGVTAVMAPDYYQFLQTGQLVGQLGGMKGAAEYEQLVVDRNYWPSTGMAARAMNAISISHILIIILIIMGNVGYFAQRMIKAKGK